MVDRRSLLCLTVFCCTGSLAQLPPSEQEKSKFYECSVIHAKTVEFKSAPHCDPDESASTFGRMAASWTGQKGLKLGVSGFLSGPNGLYEEYWCERTSLFGLNLLRPPCPSELSVSFISEQQRYLEAKERVLAQQQEEARQQQLQQQKEAAAERARREAEIQERGYQRVSITDLQLDAKSMPSGKRLAITGYYQVVGHQEALSEIEMPRQAQPANAYRLLLLTEDAPRDARKRLIDLQKRACGEYEICQVTILGRVEACTETYMGRGVRDTTCLAVDEVR